MRKLLFIFILCATSFSFAQIGKVSKSEEIGKIAPVGQFVIDCQKSGDTYTFMYKDWGPSHFDEYKKFSFKDEDNAFENLYEVIIQGFKDMPETDIILDVPDGYLWLKYERNMRGKLVSLRFSEDNNQSPIGYSRQLTQRDIRKLFGK